MDARLRRRLEMAVRVRDFLRAHRTDGVAEGAALARLEELVQRAEVLAAQQRAGIVATRAATEMRAEDTVFFNQIRDVRLPLVGPPAGHGHHEQSNCGDIHDRGSLPHPPNGQPETHRLRSGTLRARNQQYLDFAWTAA